MNSSKKPLIWTGKKWIRTRPIARDGECLVSRWRSPCRVRSCTSFSDEPMTGWMAAAVVTLMIRDVLLRIHHVIGEPPTYGYRRYGRLRRRQAELMVCPRSMPKRKCYRIMRQNALLLERKTCCTAIIETAIQAEWPKESNQRWCSGGFESSAVITERDCVSRSRWTAVIVRALHCCGHYRRLQQWNSTGRHAGSGGTPLRQRSSVVSSWSGWRIMVHATGLMKHASSPGCWDLNHNTAVESGE